jgi:hypothetical protein
VKGEQQILAFNRGLISRLAMARTDLKRYPMSAQEQTNYMPRVLGSAMLRPGMGYLGTTRSNTRAKMLDFIFASDDTAVLELTDSNLRIWVNDALVTRQAVTAVFANGTFDANLAGWTDIDQTTQTISQWVAGGYMGLSGYGDSYAGRRQAVTINEVNTVHGLRVVVARGEVEVLVGATPGGDDYFHVTLGVGTHSLAFTPTGNITVDIRSFTEYESLVDSVSFDVAGVLTLPTPWTEALLQYVRKDQSGDVLFVSCTGLQQRRIERRGVTSWSIVLYETENGPFRVINTTPVTISNTLIRGTTALTASQPTFKLAHVGALFRLKSNGQDVERVFEALNEVGDQIVVTGVGDTREFTVTISGAFVATITLQRSVGDTGVWEDTATTYTAPGTATFNDTLDNQIIAYRLKCTAYTSGTSDGQLSYQYGSITGVVRIITVTNSLVATASVLKTLGSLTGSTTDWNEGCWSDYRGWPSAVALDEGRLWWAGKDKWYGSVTDDFHNFDPDYEGDAAPIIRSIGSGPVDVINWLLPLQRLLAGTDGSVVMGRSNSFDEPLTNSNFNPKIPLTQGSARIQALKIDNTGVYVQRGGRRMLSISPSADGTSSYAAEDLTQLVPEVTTTGVVAFAIQRQPDTRIHCVLADGTVAVMVYDKTEDVKCWIEVETTGASGLVEDVLVMPGTGGEDAVYYVVNRTIGGTTKRYFERWAREDESIGGTVSKLADSFVTYDGSNLSHLEGEEVIGWYNGVALDPVTVSGGAASGMPVGAIVGLTYRARFKSTKLAYVTQPGESGMPSRKRLNALALVLADTHPQGVRYGRDFVTMDDLPLQEAYQDVDPDAVWEAYNYEAFSLPGEWGVDERLCLESNAPYPCTLLAAIPVLASNSTT